MVWACSVKECRVCRKVGDWHGFAREEEKRETSKEVYVLEGGRAMEKDAEDRTKWRRIIHGGNPNRTS